MKLGDVKGESKDSKHKDEIDVLAWSWGMSQSGNMHMGGGGGSGKASVQDLSVTKWVDKSSPILMLYAANGDHFSKATLVVRKAGKTPLDYITIVMTKVLVTSVSTGGSGGEDRLTENAEDLVDRAGGSWTVLLVAVVVIGAPIVEELFYRGLLQRSLADRFNEGAVLVFVAAVFAAVHFRPIEFPGLFVFGLILGWAALRYRRLGPAITIHVGFNLTGLLLVL